MPSPLHRSLFTAGVGAWLAVVVAKFGNPVIFHDRLEAPTDAVQWLLFSWPMSWSLIAVGLLLLVALPLAQWRCAVPKPLLLCSVGWFAWQLLSATQTVDGRLTQVCLAHFAGVLICFGVGLFALGPVRDLRWLWLGLALGLLFVLGNGLEQHFGGLERTRQAFEQLPADVRARLDSPEFRKKLSSARIFGTFVYPNALAGAILLLVPPTCVGLWRSVAASSLAVGRVLSGLVAVAGLACLYWSGSKAGWLIALLLLVLVGSNLPMRRAVKFASLAGLLTVGLAVFAWKYADYFQRGATSASARLDYWRAAWQAMQEKPALGSGTGTFARTYPRLKPPEAEMTRLAHNDYLQQGADSGWIGLLTYAAWVFGSLGWLRRRCHRDTIRWAMWLGVTGFAIQSLVEFGLYIPALAWPAFLFLGWLAASWDEEAQNSKLKVQEKLK